MAAARLRSISYSPVPQFTEGRIQQLCSQAIAVKNSEEIESVVGELRSALEQHIRLAKESLESQASAITALEAKNSSR